KGMAFANASKGRHIITTSIEHHAVIHTCGYLEKQGFEVTYLPVDRYGMVSLEEVKKTIRDDTILISVMTANNEIGTIQPIREIGALAREKGIVFHTDSVQAAGHVKIDVDEMNIDLMSVSGHKIGAQKGVGFLYIRKGTEIEPFIHGGAQEMNLRAGTENVSAILGMAKAIELADKEMEEERIRLSRLRDMLMDGILERIPCSFLNGHPTERLPGNCNISFDFVEGESVVRMLDMKGICASGGSACSSGSSVPSHVLMSTGLKKERARGAVRFSLGHINTEEEVETVLEELPQIIEKLRKMSPLYADFKWNLLT
ncbi:MAG: aminotransferase class V-fold PLP-dependent enzyme, partial [Firmicutes bacterium]|nr:aminotransferase class V-fold PLP-dependent enzyme [Bacillota bacterium]